MKAKTAPEGRLLKMPRENMLLEERWPPRGSSAKRARSWT